MNPMHMQLTTALPLASAHDPDFALATLLAVDAQIAADICYGAGTTLQIHAVRITIEPTIVAQAPPKLMYVQSEWEVSTGRAVAVAAPALLVEHSAPCQS
jgi:hypothetical protein